MESMVTQVINAMRIASYSGWAWSKTRALETKKKHESNREESSRRPLRIARKGPGARARSLLEAKSTAIDSHRGRN